MNDHRSGMSYLLGLDESRPDIEDRLTWAKVLTALTLSRPVNQHGIEARQIARREALQRCRGMA